MSESGTGVQLSSPHCRVETRGSSEPCGSTEVFASIKGMATDLGYRCADCTHEWLDKAVVCPACGSTRVGRHFGVGMAATVHMKASIEGLADNRRGEVETIQYFTASGSRSDSTLSPAGIELTLRAPVNAGRISEPPVTERVLRHLRSEGRVASLLEAEDNRGEDSVIVCDGERITVQIVTVPGSTEFLKQASLGSASTTVTNEGAAHWIASAVKKKQGKYALTDRAHTLLAIDAQMVGVLASPQVAAAVAQFHGDICQQSGFGAVWIVGPSDSRCTRIGSSSF